MAKEYNLGKVTGPQGPKGDKGDRGISALTFQGIHRAAGAPALNQVFLTADGFSRTPDINDNFVYVYYDTTNRKTYLINARFTGSNPVSGKYAVTNTALQCVGDDKTLSDIIDGSTVVAKSRSADDLADGKVLSLQKGGTGATTQLGAANNIGKQIKFGNDSATTKKGYVKFATVVLTAAWQTISTRLELVDDNRVNNSRLPCGINIQLNPTDSILEPKVELLYGDDSYVSAIYVSYNPTFAPGASNIVNFYYKVSSTYDTMYVKQLYGYARIQPLSEKFQLLDNVKSLNDIIDKLPTDFTNTKITELAGYVDLTTPHDGNYPQMSVGQAQYFSKYKIYALPTANTWYKVATIAFTDANIDMYSMGSALLQMNRYHPESDIADPNYTESAAFELDWRAMNGAWNAADCEIRIMYGRAAISKIAIGISDTELNLYILAHGAVPNTFMITVTDEGREEGRCDLLKLVQEEIGEALPTTETIKSLQDNRAAKYDNTGKEIATSYLPLTGGGMTGRIVSDANVDDKISLREPDMDSAIVPTASLNNIIAFRDKNNIIMGAVGSKQYTNDIISTILQTNRTINNTSYWTGAELKIDNAGKQFFDIRASIRPQITATYDLGSASFKWQNIWVSRGIYNNNGNLIALPGKVGTIALKSDIDDAVAGLVNSAPETLDTLNELSAALGNDPNFATTIATEIGKKLDKTTYGVKITQIDNSLNNKAERNGSYPEMTVGNAVKATKLSNTTAMGSAVRPVYFTADGVPAAGTYTLAEACTKKIKHLTTKGNTEYTTDPDSRVYLPTMNVLSFWDGAYDGNSSNLTYSVNGVIVGTSATQTISGLKTFTNSNVFKNNRTVLQSPNIVATQNPASQITLALDYKDMNNAYLGCLERVRKTDGSDEMRFAMRHNNSVWSYLGIAHNGDGNEYAYCPTPSNTGDNSTKIATTGWVRNATGNTMLNAASANKANQDSAGQQINSTYIKSLSVSGRTVTYTKGDGTSGTITTQDTNTTYGIASSSTAGLVKPIGVITKPTVNSATTTAGRYYGVQMSNDGNMFVNVPWQVSSIANTVTTDAAQTISGTKTFTSAATQMYGLRLKNTGNYGCKLNFGDGDYVYLSENTDDKLTIRAKEISFDGVTQGIKFNNSVGNSGDVLVSNGAQSPTWKAMPKPTDVDLTWKYWSQSNKPSSTSGGTEFHVSATKLDFAGISFYYGKHIAPLNSDVWSLCMSVSNARTIIVTPLETTGLGGTTVPVVSSGIFDGSFNVVRGLNWGYPGVQVDTNSADGFNFLILCVGL